MKQETQEFRQELGAWGGGGRWGAETGKAGERNREKRGTAAAGRGAKRKQPQRLQSRAWGHQITGATSAWR